MGNEFQSALQRALPLKLHGRDIPHGTIETNRTCNIQCRHCYTLDKKTIKTAAEIENEIRLLLSKRNLDVITLLGGEPTLHPELCRIVRFIKSKRLHCQLLTNGIRLMQDDRLLDDLIDAGIDKFLLHIDEGQRHVHGDIDRARRSLFAKLEEKKAAFSLALTVPNRDRGSIAAALTGYSGYRYFDGILAILARDPRPPKKESATLLREYRRLKEKLWLKPVAYLPLLNDDRTPSWLVYYFYHNGRSGKTFTLSPELVSGYRFLYRKLRGRHFFAPFQRPSRRLIQLLSALLLEALLRPPRIPAIREFLSGSGWLRDIRFRYVAIQTPPCLNKKTGTIRICHGCPDATIRNGRLTPVCIADQVNPPAGRRPDWKIQTAWAETVDRHFQEA